MKAIGSRRVLLAAAAASGAMLAVALVAQYGFGLQPCELCMLQRYPYVAVMGIGLLAAALGKSRRLLAGAAVLCGLLFWLDAGIAGYHAGVEAGVFAGPTACSGSGKQGQTLEEMRQEIMNAALVSCDQPMLHVLGLSMAAWNGLAALALGAGVFAALRRGAAKGGAV
jgi:disulfide bond formation protein DsbB